MFDLHILRHGFLELSYLVYLKSERRHPLRLSRLTSSLGICKLVLGLFLLATLALDLGLVLVKLHELSEIELWLFEKLDLSDEHILEREDLSALLDNLLAKRILDAILYNLLYQLDSRLEESEKDKG